MHAGLFDASPRSRELIYVLLAQRAALGDRRSRQGDNEEERDPDADVARHLEIHVSHSSRGTRLRNGGHVRHLP